MSVKNITSTEFWPTLKKLFPDLPESCSRVNIYTKVDECVVVEATFYVNESKEVITEKFKLVPIDDD